MRTQESHGGHLGRGTGVPVDGKGTTAAKIAGALALPLRRNHPGPAAGRLMSSPSLPAV